MDGIYRALIPVAIWLGLAAFALALIMMLARQPFLFSLTAGGILDGAQALFLLAVASYCALRAPKGA